VSDVKTVKQNRFTCRVSEEHHETVDADAPATRWRKAMFKTGTAPIEYMYTNKEIYSRINESLVDVLRFVVTLCLLSHLLLEARPLLEWVIQLSVCIAKLLPTHKALKAFAEACA
jgi:hypothetical protein